MSQLGIDVCAVILRGAEATRGGPAALGAIAWYVHPIKGSPPAAIAEEYRTYCYTPGNPRTYAEAAINTRMSALFAALSELEKEDFIIDGKDYRGLDSGNYIANVVAEFGASCFGPTGDSPYLEFAFAETSIMRGEFQPTSTFTDAGRVFIDGSSYAGMASKVEEEAELGFLGVIGLNSIIASEDSSLMVGVNFSYSQETTTSTANTWGVRLGEYLNPLAPGGAYTARMYFLRPSPLWAMELKYFGFPTSQYPGPPTIDFINSAPVRILFTVPYLSEVLENRLPLG